MGSNPSPDGRSSDQGESRYYRAQENSKDGFSEKTRVKEGESVYNTRRAPIQEQKELQNIVDIIRRAPHQEQEELQINDDKKTREKGGACQPISTIQFLLIFNCNLMLVEEGIIF